jgi:hypothetical protein
VQPDQTESLQPDETLVPTLNPTNGVVVEKEDDKENNIDDELEQPDQMDNLKPEEIFPPSSNPTIRPTYAPPTKAPTFPQTNNPTTQPSIGVQSSSLLEGQLPNVLIDFWVDSALSQANNSSDSITPINKNLTIFFQELVETLLVANRIMSATSLHSTELQVFIGNAPDAAAISKSPSTDASLLQISLDGMIYYHPVEVTSAANAKTNEGIDDEEEKIKESISHSFVVYLTFWGASDLETRLEECGFVNPTITSVRVDGREVITAVQEGDDEFDVLLEGGSAGAASSSGSTVISVRSCLQRLILLVGILGLVAP